LFFPTTSALLPIPFDIFWNNTRDPSTRSSDEAQVLSAPIPPSHPSSERNWNSLSTYAVASYASVRSKGPPSRLMRALFLLSTKWVKEGAAQICHATEPDFTHLHILCPEVRLREKIYG
jgi:hypothetical protein